MSGTIPLVVKYFREIEWGGMEAAIMSIKLQRIVTELEFVWYVIIYTLSCRSDSISSGANSGAATSSKPERKRKSADALSDVEKIPPKRIRSSVSFLDAYYYSLDQIVSHSAQRECQR